MKMTILRYLPTTLLEGITQATTKPIVATALEMVMCHVLSLNLPEDQETAIVTKPAMRYGGQVRTKVIVSLKPRVSTTVRVVLAQNHLFSRQRTIHQWERNS